MMKHKFVVLLLAGAMMLSLAACGTNTASPSDNGSASVSQPPVTTPDTTPTQTGTTVTAGSQTVKLTLSFHMTDYANREKHTHMDFSIDDALLENITVDYEIGDIIYYPPDPPTPCTTTTTAAPSPPGWRSSHGWTRRVLTHWDCMQTMWK